MSGSPFDTLRAGFCKQILISSAILAGIALLFLFSGPNRLKNQELTRPRGDAKPKPGISHIPTFPLWDASATRGASNQGDANPAGIHAGRGVKWGGALNSAQHDGTGLFNPKTAREFAASIDPSLSKYLMELNSRSFLPDTGTEYLKDVFPHVKGSGKSTVYLQFGEHPLAPQREILSATGIELLSYVSGYAWTARGTPEAFKAALNLDFVRAVAEIDPRDKMQPLVFKGEIPPYALDGNGLTRFMLLAYPGTSAETMVHEFSNSVALAGAKLQPAPPSSIGPRFAVLARRGLAQNIAALDSIAYVGLVSPRVASRDSVTDIESNIPDVRDATPGVTGSGVTVAVREIGKMDPHVDFASRLQYINSDGTTDSSNVNHATEVTGQIGSNGVNQPAAKGIAPNVTMLAYSLTGDTFLTNDIVDAGSKGARISNHAYGPSGLTVWGDYEADSADWDTALRNNNLIGFFASNEETGGLYNHIDHFVGAKNTICMSASSSAARAGDDSPPITQTNGIAAFSEFGPMSDGRIKPDLVADGDSITLDQGTNSTQTNSGTSFACSVGTGVAALVFERYKTVIGSEPSAALTKALLCNSASDLGLPGPDATYGFGLLNAKAAIETINAHTATSSPFFEGTLSNGGTAVFTFTVGSNSNPAQLKGTLCWLDVAGNPGVSKALVNDLDLQLISPGGVVFYPYSLDPSNPSAAATNTQPNHVDPIEQTVVANPAPGVWTINVIATSIPQGGQSFAVCLNVSSGPMTPQFTSVATASPSIALVTQTVSFNAAATDPNGGAVTITWDFGDGTTATGASVSHAYSAIGSFTATATASSSGGTTSSGVAVTVGNAPGITSALLASGTQNSAFNYAIAAAGFAPITFRAQNLPAGLSLSGNTISGTPTVAGSVAVTLTATNSLGADNETLVLNIALPAGTANAPPVLFVPPTSVSNTGTVGQPVAFSVAATDPGGNQLSYTWNFGDGSSAVGANVSHVFGAFGIYTVTVTVSDGTNAVASTLNFVVNAVDTTGSNVAGADWDVAALNAFKILKGAMKFNFASSTKDTLMYSGTIPVLKAFIPAGKTVTVAIGVLKKTFTLNARGQGSTGASKFQMQGKMKKGVFKATPAKFALKIRGEPLLGTFSQFGFANVNTIKTGEPHGVPVIIMIDQTGYENMAATLYKAKAGKSGTATVSK